MTIGERLAHVVIAAIAWGLLVSYLVALRLSK